MCRCGTLGHDLLGTVVMGCRLDLILRGLFQLMILQFTELQVPKPRCLWDGSQLSPPAETRSQPQPRAASAGSPGALPRPAGARASPHGRRHGGLVPRQRRPTRRGTTILTVQYLAPDNRATKGLVGLAKKRLGFFFFFENKHAVMLGKMKRSRERASFTFCGTASYSVSH